MHVTRVHRAVDEVAVKTRGPKTPSERTAALGHHCDSRKARPSHVQRMMAIRSPLSDFLAPWSSHCQVKNRPDRADSADPYYQTLLSLLHCR